MVRPLVWDPTYAKNYQTGLDRGVLYLNSNNDAYAWNGLISVEEQSSEGEIRSYYIDGVKYLDVASPKDFSAKISAYSAPREFGMCLSEASIRRGVVITGQPRSSFGMSYRSMIGENAYHIHLIYNAMASLGTRPYETLSGSSSPIVFEWNIDAVPFEGTEYRPTAHYIIDSRKISKEDLKTVEVALYGRDLGEWALDGQYDLDQIVDGNTTSLVYDGNQKDVLPDISGRLPSPEYFRELFTTS